jgi:hypothetical protein
MPHFAHDEHNLDCVTFSGQINVIIADDNVIIQPGDNTNVTFSQIIPSDKGNGIICIDR